MNIKRLLTNKYTSWVTGVALLVSLYNFQIIYSSLILYLGAYMTFGVFVGSIVIRLIGSVDESDK